MEAGASTFISLLVIPVIFSVVDDVVQWLRKVTHRRPAGAAGVVSGEAGALPPQART